jgi:protein FRA10AC1
LQEYLFLANRFVRSDQNEESTWEQRVAKKYYDKLFKEYAICELKFYKQGKIALRWRTEKEVMVGKGQFMCASTQCDSNKGLKSWEVNFSYVEDGEKKNELVKVRLCPECSEKLNYKTKVRLAQTLKRKQEEEKTSKREKKSRRNSSASSSSSGNL